MKFVYPAVFKKKEDGMIHVTFPDLEGCYAEGTLRENRSWPDCRGRC